MAPAVSAFQVSQPALDERVDKVVHIYFYASLCLCCSEAMVHKPKNDSVPSVLAFGDSFFDTGNNNYLKTAAKADFPPYGKDFMGGKATGRFSNGKTISDYFVEILGVKEYLPAYLDPYIQDEDLPTGVSFASAGSGYDPLTPMSLNVIPLFLQLELFKRYIAKLNTIVGEKAANHIIRKSVYLISASSNDWGITYTSVPIRRLEYNVSAYANLLVNQATNFAKELYKSGARRIVFWGTPSIGCWPLARIIDGGGLRVCGEKFNEEAKIFNIMLKRRIKILRSSLPQSRICYVDYFNIVLAILKNAREYGMY
ncbi:hypothetical protein L1887_28533 [Cichorium endivia]|nr:hypothetical protein L1887_28533 [Cichorium endivia]